jgi:phosphotransferase system enzyme I (PtsI)
MSGHATKNPVELHGMPISPGIAQGPLYLFKQIELSALERNSFPVDDPQAEIDRLETAIQKSKGQLHRIKMEAILSGNPGIGEVFQVHIQLLEDQAFLASVRELLTHQKLNIEYVLANQISAIEKQFSRIEDEALRKRFADIQDVYHRLLRNLLDIEHVRSNPLKRLERPVVLVAERLIPSDIALLDFEDVLGIIMEKGDETSHAAIIAKSLDMPVVVNVPGISSIVRNNDKVVVDGDRGIIILHPTVAQQRRYTRAHEAHQRQQQEADQRVVASPCRTLDGVRIRIKANIGSYHEARIALSRGAEGIGLLRTELYYMSMHRMPHAEEECDYYKSIAKIFNRGDITIRTLDIGADKNIPYLDLLEEENPQLGCRGIRYLLSHTALFRKQLHSILAAAGAGTIRILLPFVTVVEDVTAALGLIDESCEMAGVDRDAIKVGIMVEIPSVAMAIEAFAEMVDFFSIGTNDLVQYTFAAGRDNDQLREYRRTYHPVILRLIQRVASSAAAANREVSVCGEIEHPHVARLFAGLGIRTFSVEPAMVGQIYESLGSASTAEMAGLAQKALALRTAADVEELLANRGE